MTRRRLLLTGRLPDSVETRMAAEYELRFAEGPPTPESLTADSLGRQAEDCAVLVTGGAVRCDAAVIAALPDSVKAIATYSVGYDHIDLEAARARGLAVFHTPDVLTDACAETAMLLLLGAARRATEAIALLRSGQWSGFSPLAFNGIGITGKRLSILGMGRIGRAVADRARGFGMGIDYHNRSRLPPDQEGDAVWHADLRAFLSGARFLVVTCPATAETHHLLNAERLGWMPPGAILVNIGRGSVIDDAGLIPALRSGRLYAAGLDVFDHEPKIHPDYLGLPNLFGLPHIGSATVEAREAMGVLLLDGLRALWAGQSAVNRLV